MQRGKLQQFAYLSIGAALLTMALKTGAYLLTGSVSLLSDALESGVNLAAAIMALAALRYAAQPPDADHTYGHDKAEYFSSALEGVLIMAAAFGIAGTALPRLFDAHPLRQVETGAVISGLAAVINLIVGGVLMRAGKRYRSITLEADAQHLLTDVWTSVGILAGVIGVVVTGWSILDPLIALGMAGYIIYSGLKIMRRSALGLLDTALPEADQAIIRGVLGHYQKQGIQTHALRTRQSGARRFISLHVLVPPQWTVGQGHAMLEQLEGELCAALPYTTVFTHLEPLDDPASFADVGLDRDDHGR